MDSAISKPVPTETEDFPDLMTGPIEVPIPHVSIAASAADFTNSRNEVAQLTAWLAKLETESMVQLLQKLYDYNHGSLYGFMRLWCLVGEGFDPCVDDWRSSGSVDLTVSESDVLIYQQTPKKDGVAMWQALHKQAATQTVNLRRVLHFLIFLYSNDRLTTRYSGTENNGGFPGPGAPGELVTSMSAMLKSHRDRNINANDPVYYPRYGCWNIQSGKRTFTPQPLKAGRDFAMLAPGWVEYMQGSLGTLRQALAYPPFDDNTKEQSLYEEMFFKGIRQTTSQSKRKFLQIIGKEISDVAAKTTDESNRHICVVCMVGARNMVFMPCSHFVTCKLCSETLQECPMCRNPLMGKLEVFF